MQYLIRVIATFVRKKVITEEGQLLSNPPRMQYPACEDEPTSLAHAKQAQIILARNLGHTDLR